MPEPRYCHQGAPTCGSDPGGGNVYVGQINTAPWCMTLDEAREFADDLLFHIIRAATPTSAELPHDQQT